VKDKKGGNLFQEKGKEDLIKRDHQDIHRSLSPLKPAKDATIIDTTLLGIDQVVEVMIKEIKGANRKR